MIKDSGSRTEFETGAVRDIQEGKGRFDLVPIWEFMNVVNVSNSIDEDEDSVLTNLGIFTKNGEFRYLELAANCMIDECFNGNIYLALTELAHHFEEGALKYEANNWKKGIPVERYLDSAVRHYCKFKMNITDERHDRACLWNLVCCLWTLENLAVPGSH